MEPPNVVVARRFQQNARATVVQVEEPHSPFDAREKQTVLFFVENEPPALLRAGDRVRFRAITREEFDAWKA